MRTEDGYIIRQCLNEKPEVFGILVDKYKSAVSIDGDYAIVGAAGVDDKSGLSISVI